MCISGKNFLRKPTKNEHYLFVLLKIEKISGKKKKYLEKIFLKNREKMNFIDVLSGKFIFAKL